ncbi:FxLYD domain-containing protein [Streptomyces sp. NPDC050256]|uniref:FxLYD domain-containing protein n=1 Tax=Streptomyces sp. NPDC050256 TaxID=3365607 RepID=UPI003788DB46
MGKQRRQRLARSVEIRRHIGRRLTEAEADEDCDDSDNLSYNDCDAEATFKYKIRNDGDEIASYSAVINAFDEDGNFIGQDYVSVSHLAPGKTKSDENEFSTYSSFEGDNKPSDIATLRVAHVERVALAN